MALRRGTCRLVLAALMLQLCAFAAPAAEPKQKWLTVSSAHFSAVTDGDEKKVREAILRFEQMRSVFAQLLGRSRVNLPLPLEILAVKTATEYNQVSPGGAGQLRPPAVFLRGEDRNIVVLNLEQPNHYRSIAREFGRLLLDYNYPPTQGWFDEGFGEYFASIQLDEKTVRLGGDPQTGGSRTLTALLKATPKFDLVELFSHPATEYPEKGGPTLFAAQSWMVMHYLLNKNRLAEAGTYFDLVQNQKLAVADAIQKAFGVSAAQLGDAVGEYFRSVEGHMVEGPAATAAGAASAIAVTPSPVGMNDVGVSSQEMKAYEGRAWVAEAMVRIPEQRGQGMNDLSNLAEEATTDSAVARRALAWVHMQNKEYPEAVEELSKAMDFDSKDVYVRYYLALVKYKAADAAGQSFQGLANMMLDLREVLDAYPEFAEAYNMLALARLQGGGNASATESMRSALLLNPRSERYRLNMADIYIAGKKWDSATALLEALKTSSDAKVASGARQRLQDLPMLKKYGILPQRTQTMAASEPPPVVHGTPLPRPATPEAKKAELAREEAESDAADSEPARPPEPQPDRRPMKYMKGKIVSVDCAQAPAAVVTVSAPGKRPMKFRTEDYKALLLIGTETFSCGWTGNAVSVNYKAGGKADGDLVSLEVN